MDVQAQVQAGSRLERILKKLLSKQDLINKEELGEIEIHFKQQSETVQIKVMIK